METKSIPSMRVDGSKKLWDCAVHCEICIDKFYGPLDLHKHKFTGSTEINESSIAVAILQQRAVIFSHCCIWLKLWSMFFLQ